MSKEQAYLESNKENAEEIRKRIREEVEFEAKKILVVASSEAAEILKNAQSTAEKKKQETFSGLDLEIHNMREKIFSALNLEKKRIILSEKNTLIEEIFTQVKLGVEAFRNSDEYRTFLKKAIVEAVKVIDSSSLDVSYSFIDDKVINAEFKEELSKLCDSKFNKNVTLNFIKSDFKDIGFITQSKDGKVIFDNTFLFRLKRVYDDIYMDLMRKL